MQQIINPMFDNSIIFENPMIIEYMERTSGKWKFVGWARNTSKVKFGCVGIDNYDYVTVFKKGFSDKPESDEPTKEIELIKSGLNGIVLFYGSDNTSFMVRFKQGKLQRGQIDLSVFDDSMLDKSLFYNS